MGLADKTSNLPKYLNFWREARWNCKVSAPPCFSICNRLNSSPWNQHWKVVLKSPNPSRGIIYQLLKASGEGKVEITFNFKPNSLCTSCASSSNLKRSAHHYLLYLLTSYVLTERVEVYGRYLCKCVIGNLRSRQVVFWVLRVPWCHACKFDALTRIIFSRPATAFTCFSALILLNHDK